MKRPKKIKGLCGNFFIQSERTINGHASFECSEFCITCDLFHVKEECLKTCEECEINKEHNFDLAEERIGGKDVLCSYK